MISAYVFFVVIQDIEGTSPEPDVKFLEENCSRPPPPLPHSTVVDSRLLGGIVSFCTWTFCSTCWRCFFQIQTIVLASDDWSGMSHPASWTAQKLLSRIWIRDRERMRDKTYERVLFFVGQSNIFLCHFRDGLYIYIFNQNEEFASIALRMPVLPRWGLTIQSKMCSHIGKCGLHWT